MSDLMLLGVLNAPLPDDPADLGIAEWTALRSAARSAGSRIEALELEKDVERQRAQARKGECEAKAQIIADLEHQLAEAEADAERLAAQVEALWPKSAGSCPALATHRARKDTTHPWLKHTETGSSGRHLSDKKRSLPIGPCALALGNSTEARRARRKQWLCAARSRPITRISHDR